MLLGPVSLTQASDGCFSWGRGIDGVTSAELAGRPPRRGGAGAGTPGPQSGWKAWEMESRLGLGYWEGEGDMEGMCPNPGQDDVGSWRELWGGLSLESGLDPGAVAVGVGLRPQSSWGGGAGR